MAFWGCLQWKKVMGDCVHCKQFIADEFRGLLGQMCVSTRVNESGRPSENGDFRSFPNRFRDGCLALQVSDRPP